VRGDDDSPPEASASFVERVSGSEVDPAAFSLAERARHYASRGLWFDAVVPLMNLHSDGTAVTEFPVEFTDLMQSAGLPTDMLD
jgi:hypothetical protein